MITGSVGSSGANKPNDVATIQYLLNCVPGGQGGPPVELAVDGFIGPKTIAAITGFQKARLGFADGRVDPGGKSLTALNAFDPNPNSPPVTPAGYGGKSGGKGPGKDPYAKGSGQDPYGKGPGKVPGYDPYGKTPGKVPGYDPYGKTPGKMPGYGPYGKTPVTAPGYDPYGKTPGKTPPGKGF